MVFIIPEGVASHPLIKVLPLSAPLLRPEDLPDGFLEKLFERFLPMETPVWLKTDISAAFEDLMNSIPSLKKTLCLLPHYSGTFDHELGYLLNRSLRFKIKFGERSKSLLGLLLNRRKYPRGDFIAFDEGLTFCRVNDDRAHSVFHYIGDSYCYPGDPHGVSHSQCAQLVATLLGSTAKYFVVLENKGYAVFVVEEVEDVNFKGREKIQIKKYPPGTEFRSYDNGGYEEVERMIKISAICSTNHKKLDGEPINNLLSKYSRPRQRHPCQGTWVLANGDEIEYNRVYAKEAFGVELEIGCSSVGRFHRHSRALLR